MAKILEEDEIRSPAIKQSLHTTLVIPQSNNNIQNNSTQLQFNDSNSLDDDRWNN